MPNTSSLAQIRLFLPLRRPLPLFAVLGAVAASLVAATPAANAQANLVFSGGSGTPLILTLTAPVTYTITTTTTNALPIFNFQGTGNVAPGAFNSVTGTLTYTVDGGAPITLNTLSSGYTGGAVAATDAFVYNSSSNSTLNVGDILRLVSGTLTTTSNIAAAAPTSGSYTTFVTNGNTAGVDISSNGVAGGTASAPEPGSIALLALSGLPAVGIITRRRRKVA